MAIQQPSHTAAAGYWLPSDDDPSTRLPVSQIGCLLYAAPADGAGTCVIVPDPVFGWWDARDCVPLVSIMDTSPSSPPSSVAVSWVDRSVIVEPTVPQFQGVALLVQTTNPAGNLEPIGFGLHMIRRN